ncbi:MAG: hypothetical protein D6695_12345 [Planctomycetota bacterium]|nr:MAG: hypothetical protein D6695_12345 [Planctomycetota bacterium]
MRLFLQLACIMALGLSACAEPINRYCPVGKEPIVQSAGTIMYGGHEIGFCCPGCDDMFLAWDAKRRDEFVQLALAGREPGLQKVEQGAKPSGQAANGWAYTLQSCPVSGHEINGDPVVLMHEGREIRFCCEDCVSEFQLSPGRYLAKIDEQMIAQQRLHYPLTTCVLSGESMIEQGTFTGVDVIYRNRLVRFCCERCAGKFAADPNPVLAELDAKIAERQRKSYPLQTCLISGNELGSMGEPVERFCMNRLVRFCCASCIDTFEKNPVTSMAKLDRAYAERQRASANKVCPVSGEQLDEDAIELVAGDRLVRFCCERCAGKFKANPEKYLPALGSE